MSAPPVIRVFAGHDGGSGCAYYRMTLPLAELGRHDGFEVTYANSSYGPGRPPGITLSQLQGHHVIVAQRWNKHDGLATWRRARGPYSRLVYELDDDLWNVSAENWNAYHLYGDPKIQDATQHAAETADLVTVSTEPLARVMREVAGHDRVAVLPNCIPGWVIRLPRPAERDRPRAGWQGGASHGVDIGEVASPVRRFLRRFPGWDLQLNGQDYRETFAGAGVPEDRMFHVGWVPVYEHPEEYFAGIDFDIGLAPLWPTPFNDSKSFIKVVEYGARGIPSIASDCPAYRDVITHGVDGFLVKQDHEWLKYLSELAADDELRVKMGAAAREMASRHLIEDHWQDWAAAYRGMWQ
jgi:glycosyltransferase involved in cell wall biosynthesis